MARAFASGPLHFCSGYHLFHNHGSGTDLAIARRLDLTLILAQDDSTRLIVKLVIALGLLVWWVLRRKSQPREIVLGQELADAQARDEQARRNAGPSPLPLHVYAPREQSLVHPREVPLDAELRAVVQRFAAADDTARRGMREAIRLDGFYELLTFAKREAVFAMRDGKAEGIRTAWTSVAIVDITRIDSRDALLTFAVLYYATRKCGTNPAPLLEDAAAMSTAEMREALTEFAAARESHKSLAQWRLLDVGTGFIRRDTARFQPAYDLITAAVRVHDLVAEDRYPSATVSIADNFSDHWFPDAEKAYRRIRAGAVLHANGGEGEQRQTLMIFLAEAADASDAEALRASFRVGKQDASFAMTRENLLAVIVATTILANTSTLETNESLERFAEPLAKILTDARNSPAPT